MVYRFTSKVKWLTQEQIISGVQAKIQETKSPNSPDVMMTACFSYAEANKLDVKISGGETFMVNNGQLDKGNFLEFTFSNKKN